MHIEGDINVIANMMRVLKRENIGAVISLEDAMQNLLHKSNWQKRFLVQPVEQNLQKKSMHASILDAPLKSMSLDSVKNMKEINTEKKNKKKVFGIVILQGDASLSVKMI